MNKFAVLEQIGEFSPSVKETFDNVADATTFANIMRRRYPQRVYGVYQINEEL